MRVTPKQPLIELVEKKLGWELFTFLNQKEIFRNTLDLLITSLSITEGFKGKFYIRPIGYQREFSYVVAPTAKALEGVLLAIAHEKNIISQADLDKGLLIGKIYDNLNGKQAVAKTFVLKEKDKRLVDTIYGNWVRSRNKVLHYDEDFFVKSMTEATKLVDDIIETMRLAFQIFIGPPDFYA